MHNDDASIEPTADRAKAWIPYVTQFVCGVCGLVYIGLNLEKDPIRNPFFEWASPDAPEIFDGLYWGLLTSPFVHIEIWHVAFNVYWFWILGRVLEREIGRIRLLIFVALAGIVASGGELAFGDTTGIGLSGIVYGVFGFMWMGSRRVPAFQAMLPRNTVIMLLAWLVICYIATRTGTMNIANAAHFWGLLFGMAVGEAYINRRRVALMIPALALMLAMAATACFWNPWSPAWLGHKALKAHKAKDFSTATIFYRKYIARADNPGWALYNLTILYAETNDRANYEATLAQLRKVDPTAARKFDSPPARPGDERPAAK
jgi:membrane associated rhomboid family serine protease